MINLPQTIISQYANSPVMLSLLSSLNLAIDPTADFDAFFDTVWNVNTAVGYGLDVWGRIVGIDRYIVIPGNTLFLGFNEAGTWQDFGFGTLWDGNTNELSQSSITEMNDDNFRQAILAKALANISNCSAFSINRILMLLFGGPLRSACYVVDNQDMSFDQIKAARMAVKAARAKENTEMLNSRYLLAKRSSAEIVMSGREAHPGRTDSQPPWSDVGAA